MFWGGFFLTILNGLYKSYDRNCTIKLMLKSSAYILGHLKYLSNIFSETLVYLSIEKITK